MSLPLRRLLPVLSSAALAFSINPAANAQSCGEQLHHIAKQHAKGAVSVTSLRIPAKAWDHFEKARQASETGRLDVFEREATLSLAAAPAFAEVYILRAAVEVRARQFDAAIATVTQARRIEPETPWSSIVLASALTGLGRYDEAVAELRRTPRTDAITWQWSFERTRAEIGRGNAEQALHYSELALAAAPAGCPETRLLRANAFQIAGQRAEAATQLEAYLAVADPKAPARAQVMQALESTREKLRAENTELLAAK